MSETVQEQEEEITQILETHNNIQENHSYELLSLTENFARVALQTKLSEQVNKTSYIYEGAIFSCANFCAFAAINEKDLHLLSAKTEFFSPVRAEDEKVIFEATASTNSSGKKQVSVVAMVKEIVVFEGNFVTVRLDKESLLKKD